MMMSVISIIHIFSFLDEEFLIIVNFCLFFRF